MIYSIGAFLILSLWIGATPSQGKEVTISNVIPRTDQNGAILDAHDSSMLYLNGLYYWYAASYGNCTEPVGPSGCANGFNGCGFQENHNVSLYTSPDLVTWTNEGVVFQTEPNTPDGTVVFAPKTVYNPTTKEFILWYNYILNKQFQYSYYGVARSVDPKGPFEVINPGVDTLAYLDVGDEGLFVDDDGTAYLIYTGNIVEPTGQANHILSVEQLTPNYYKSMGKAANSGNIGHGEAPMMFKRNGIYYIVFGGGCCYCSAGSIVTAHTANHPLGPYTLSNVTFGNLTSQSTAIFPYIDDNQETQWMYVGDRWQSAPDHVKGHDFTVFSPIIFSEDGLSVTTKDFQDNFTISLAVQNADMATE